MTFAATTRVFLPGRFLLRLARRLAAPAAYDHAERAGG
jgi:hypothetical protein